MPDEPKPSNPATPSEPEPPATTPPETTREMPAEAGPPHASKPRKFVAHRGTQLVAAGIAGLLIGGGTVALIDVADNDRGRHPALNSDVQRADRGDRGPRDKVRPWQEDGKRWGGRLPEHHHDEDGSVVPGPRR